LDGATWRACAAAWGLFVPAPFLRELYAGEKHSRRATLAGGLFPDLADVAPTLALSARGRQCEATYRERRDVARLCANVRPFGPAMAFFSSAPRGFFAFVAAMARVGGVKVSHTSGPRGMRRAVQGSLGQAGSKARRQTPHVPGAD
jgi:hypothetical protein